MKPLNEYPTPECDLYKGVWATEWNNGETIFTKANSLEQRLAACREALLDAKNEFQSFIDMGAPLKVHVSCDLIIEEITETLAATTP